jgi:hypothetical protein
MLIILALNVNVTQYAMHCPLGILLAIDCMISYEILMNIIFLIESL